MPKANCAKEMLSCFRSCAKTKDPLESTACGLDCELDYVTCVAKELITAGIDIVIQVPLAEEGEEPPEVTPADIAMEVLDVEKVIKAVIALDEWERKEEIMQELQAQEEK